MKELFLSGHEDFPLFVRLFDEVPNPKGTVQIIHDCGEHSGRYIEFAEFLNQHGYIVMASDLRAHGRTAGDKIGIVEEKDYFNNVVNDNIALATYAIETYQLPLVIFANAFGGQIALAMTQRASEMINSCVLMSTPHMSEVKLNAILCLLRMQAKFVGREKPATFLLKMIDILNNRRSGDSSKPYYWLTNDEEEIEKFRNDEYSAKYMSIGFFVEYLEGIKRLYSNKRMSRIRKSLPIFLVAGDNDPVAEYGKSINALYENLADATINNLSFKLYLGKKHDLLHEIKRLEVMTDVLNFIDKNIQSEN